MSPFKSKAQAKYMFSNMPDMAKKWAKHTPNMKSLPKKKHKEEAVKHMKREHNG